MKYFSYLVNLCLLISLNLLAQQCENMGDIAQIKLAVKASGNTVYLKQSDFDTGTVRIKQPGLYILKENIEFEPITGLERPDKPAIGWFAAITVETSDGVIIDLNGKRIRATQNFINNHFFNVYANIEFDNCPFSGTLFGAIGSNFNGDTAFIAANNVLVKGGCIGRSSHWGLHGNNNSNIHMYGLRISDFEVAGVEINATQGGSIKKVEVSGLEHTITTRSIFVGLLTVQATLAQFAPFFPLAATQLAALNQFAQDNPAIFHTPITLPDGNYYGIRVSSGINVQRTEFPTSPQGCAVLAAVSGGQTARCWDMEDIFIRDLKNAPIETVAIGSQQPLNGNNLIQTSNVGIFGLLRWEDAFDANCNFAPNTFLQSQLLAALLLQANLPPGFPQPFPDNFDVIAASLGVTLGGIIPPNLALFNANAEPVFGINFNAPNVNVGIFAIRHDCSENVKVKNVKICNIQNLGQPGAELATICDGDAFTNIVTETPYLGNDSWGFEYGVVNNLSIENGKASKVLSINGSVFGLDLINAIADARVHNCETHNVQTSGDSQTDANPPAEAYGLRVADNSGAVTICKHTATNTIAPRVAFGLATEAAQGVVFKECNACNTFATSPNPNGENKTAYGFYSSENSSNTLFQCCHEKNSRILGEENVTAQTNSIAAGYVFTDADNGSTVNSSTAHNNHSGGGTANGIRIDNDSQNTTVTNNKVVGNYADLPFATGYGIIDTAAGSTATVKNNCVKKNSTANIVINK